MKIKKMVIEGFRGINNPLEIDFMNGSNPTSVVVFGRNGTGKSSITDAWEWIRNEKIEYLSRENAGYESYPNKKAKTTKVSLMLKEEDRELNLNCTLNGCKCVPEDKKKKEEFEKLLKYPCHIRYADLQNFLYKTKR